MSLVIQPGGRECPMGSGEDSPQDIQRPSAPPSRPGPQWKASTEEKLSANPMNRSRSNTLARTTGEHSVSPIPTSVFNSQRSSWDADSLNDTLNTPIDRYDSFAQTLREKTSKLWKRRQSKHARAMTSVDRCDEKCLPNHAPVLPAQDYLRHTRFVSAGNHYPGSRPNISTPYNFQHLTHTHSRQFKSVDKASENELATELSAIQAVQRSQRRLQGIAAHDLSTQSSACPSPLRQAPFSPALTSASSAYSNGERDASELVNSPPPTPPQQDYFNHNHSHFADSPDVPVVPPRKSSRAAARAAACSSQQHAGPLTSYDEGPVRGSIPLDHSKSPYFTAPQTPSETPREIWEHPAVPHAMTTPDNTAYILKSPPHRASLSNVIEEDGHSSPGQGSRPSTPGSGLRHAKSFPNTLSPAWHQEDPHSPILGYHRSFSVDDGLSQNQSLGPTVGQPLDDIPAHPLHHSRLTPASPPAFDGSWEDDIDFCYEHAAEADCDFDWTRPSLDIPEVRDEQGVLSGLRPEALQIRKRPCSSSYQLPRLHTSLSVSRLSITNSANSSIASVAGPATPANPFLISNPGEHRKACVSPTVYGPGCSFPDDTAGLESALRPVSDTEASAYGTKPLYSLHSFRFDPPVASENNSQRSSRSRISKSTSRDSFWSSRASSTSISRRKDNASASSVDSLPDLIYSQATHEQRMAGLKQNRPLLGGMQHARTKSEAILSATPPSSNVGSELLRKRSTSTTAGTMARGSSYRVFPPPTPAIKVVQ